MKDSGIFTTLARMESLESEGTWREFSGIYGLYANVLSVCVEVTLLLGLVGF